VTSDDELLTTVAHGDRTARDAAFRTLVERHRDRVHALCMRYFRDPVDAQDAVQETFLTVLRRAGTFRGEARVTTWLHRVTINTCHDIARKRARRPQTPVEDIGRVVDEVDAATDDLDALDLADVLREALATLDEETRGLLLLCAVEQVPYAEVAEVYGIAVGTVKSRVHRARAKLATMLGELLDDDDPLLPGTGTVGGGAPGSRSGPPPPARGPPVG
jgi:RNA polymerase sigma-70 factor (ECF subfamily)